MHIKRSRFAEKKSQNPFEWKHFQDYLQARKLSVLFLYIISFAVYGIWASHDVISFDAEGFYSVQNAGKWYYQWFQLNRWALVYLKRVLSATFINPYLSIALLLILFPMSAVLWSFIFWKWNGEQDHTGDLLVFGIIYLLCPIFAFQFSYRNQMDVISIMMVIMPLAMSFVINWIQHGGCFSFFCALFLLVLLFGSYQAFMIVTAQSCAIYLYLISSQEKKGDSEQYRKTFLKMLFLVFLSYLVNSLVSRELRYFNGVFENSDYLSHQFYWGKRPILENVIQIGKYVRNLIFHDPEAGTQSAMHSHVWMLYGLEIVVALMHSIIALIRKRAYGKKIAFNNLMCFCIFISPFLLELATAGNIVIRSLFSYPLTLAFMAVVELNWMRAFFSDEKKAVFQVISFCLVAAAAGKEMTVTSRLLYTDNKTMEEDYEALDRIYYTALQQGAREGDAFCFVGWKDQPRGDKITYMEDEVIGFSYLETIPLTKN